MTTVAIMQPTYLPWIGYFDIMRKANYFILLDNVQLESRGWQMRNRIKMSGKQWKWLTVPLIKQFGQSINSTIIDNTQNWRKKHWKTIENNYKRSEYWEKYYQALSEIYSREWKYLVDLNLELIYYLKNQFGIQTEILRASKLPVSGNKVRLLVNICHYFSADIYLSTPGSARYIEENNIFKSEGILLKYHQFEHPVYLQFYGEFISHLSAIDLLFNEGSKSLEILRSGS